MNPDPSAVCELEITDLSRAGSGVGRTAEGQVVFVPLTLPGDRVRARFIEPNAQAPTRERRPTRFRQAELVEILQPSPDRVIPPCPVFGACGGCLWQHVPYEKQWQTKRDGVLHALRRVQVEPPVDAAGAISISEFRAPRAYGYRNRVQARGIGASLGFFQRRSRNLVPVDGCPIAREEINAEWPRVRQAAAERFAVPGEPATMYKAEIEVLADGQTRVTYNARHGAAGFRQVNDEQNSRMREWIAARLQGREHLYDLYGGSGNLSRGLVGQFVRIDCVDVGAPAAAASPDPGKYFFHRAPSARWIARQAKARRRDGPYASAILDPPREGLADEQRVIAESLEALGVGEIIAVGCDVDAWARDVARFTRRGWRLTEMAILDFFPQTPHAESIARLTREPAPR